MENSLIHPYVTERIRRFDGSLSGVCYLAPFMHCEQESNRLVSQPDIITLHNLLPDASALIIIPLAGNSLRQFLQSTENYFHWQTANVRLAINYAGLLQGGAALREAAQHFSFWLYDLAPPGTQWKNIVSFPFSGIVLTDPFFCENYLKFSFPFLLDSIRETEAEIILRTAQLALPQATYTALPLTGWQEQRTSSNLFGG